MAALLGKFIFKKVLAENIENKQGRSDPYFETVPTRKLSTFTGKTSTKLKKRKKALPPGLSKNDEETLVKVKRRAYRLDMALGSFLGFKIGWGSVIGIFPAIGDVFDLLLSLLVIRTASEAGLPSTILIRMLINVLFDFVIGLIPLIGDLMDMAYKCNTRNAILLEEVLRARGQRNLEQQGVTGHVDDPSLGEVEYEDGTVEADGSRTVLGRRRERGGDLEAQRGGVGLGGTAPVTVAGQEHAGSRVQKPQKTKSKYEGSMKHKGQGHQRIYSQEAGETYRS